MALYGLTVTMRIHQLLTRSKISNHLKHLLSLCLDQHLSMNQEDSTMNMEYFYFLIVSAFQLIRATVMEEELMGRIVE